MHSISEQSKVIKLQIQPLFTCAYNSELDTVSIQYN